MPFNFTSAVREILLPPQNIFLLWAVGWLTQRWRPRLGVALRRTALFLLFFLCTGVGAELLVAPLESMTSVPRSLHNTGAQAIVVLSAGRYTAAPEYGGQEIPDYVALARLRYAAKLYRETGLPILVSGGSVTSNRSVKPLAQSMAKALRDEFDIPVKWSEEESRNTAENAFYSARLLKRDGINRILLVTDAMHMPRSVMAFSESGMNVVAAPTIFFSSEKFALSDLLPSVENLRRAHYAMYEWLGLAWYALRYRLTHATHSTPDCRPPQCHDN